MKTFVKLLVQKLFLPSSPKHLVTISKNNEENVSIGLKISYKFSSTFFISLHLKGDSLLNTEDDEG